jgi:hypothetical protein
LTKPLDQDFLHVMRTGRSIRYIAEPKHVREVSLIGTSDFAFWSDHLRPERLAPVRCGDAAQVMIMASEMRYLGIRFTEVSLGVRVALAADGRIEGMRLLHAFTSSRTFAWCERTFFAMPHRWAECQVSVQIPIWLSVKAVNRYAIRAEMSSVARATTRERDERWEGPVFLSRRCAAEDTRLFFARLRGHTVGYPFLSGDRVSIVGSAAGGVLRPLVDSGFSAKEWAVRADATHGRTKTYRRTAVLKSDNAA